MLSALLLAGCVGHEAVINEVMNHQHCRTLKPGIQQITEAQLPKIRGVTLLQPPALTRPALTKETSETNTSEPASPRGTAAALLIATSKGPQPTPGYAITLEGAQQTGSHVTIQYTWTTPQEDLMHAAVLTSPCSVVSLQGAGAIESIAVFLNGTLHGELQL